MEQLRRINPIKRNRFQYDSSFSKGSMTEVHIADIHFGVIDPMMQYNILAEHFLNKISTIHFDLLSIDGDIFDHKVQASSNTVLYTTLFIEACIRLCRERNATLLIIGGTASHDANQLRLFYHYLEDPTVDIRIVESTRFEFIKNKRILCIPEEYNKGREYYEKFFYQSGIYDGVCMHGTIKGSIVGRDIVDLDNTREPTFDINCFRNCWGPIVSGHIHTANCYEKHMYYTGSPFRWQFGEEQDKGFIILLHDLDSHQYRIHFETLPSTRYDTINLDFLLSKDPKDTVDYIKNLKANGIEHIRIEYNIDREDVINIIKYHFQSDPSIKFKLNFKHSKDKENIQKELDNKYQQYTYLFDSNISDYEKFTRFINQEEGHMVITVDQLIQELESEI